MEEYANVNYGHLTIYDQIAKQYGASSDKKTKNFVRCDRNYTSDKGPVITKGCQKVGKYDGDSIMHYKTTLKVQVFDGNTKRWELEDLTVLTLNEKAHSLCENGRCSPGQRERLSKNDILDIAHLYKTSCGKCYLML